MYRGGSGIFSSISRLRCDASLWIGGQSIVRLFKSSEKQSSRLDPLAPQHVLNHFSYLVRSIIFELFFFCLLETLPVDRNGDT